ncbi:hydroxymethylbilane synthase [Naumannella huperziae]
MTDRTLRIGARRSPLAVAQARWVADRLADRGIATELVGITTHGDTDPRELTQIGGTGVFAGAVRRALRDGEIDLAVHSAKDLPTVPEPGLEVVAHPAREDPRDVLVGARLEELRDGDRIGTGSPRRAAQLAAWAAGRGITLEIVPIRGNVDTRIGKVRDGELAATLLAAAGLRRLDRLDLAEGEDGAQVSGVPAEILSPQVMLPAAAQGALAVEAVPGTAAATAAAGLDDAETRARVGAERALLATLEAGCTAPVGVLASLIRRRDSGPDLTLAAVIGRTYPSTFDEAAPADPLLRVDGTAPAGEATALGATLAGELLARLDRPTP